MHEAGHALLAFLCGRQLELVTIIAEGDKHGRVSYASLEGDRKEREATEELIRIALAGRAGEKALTGRWNLVGIADDWPSAAELARTFLAEDQVLAYLREIEVAVAEVLRQPAHRAALKSLVAALLHKQTLDGLEAERIIREALATEKAGS